MTPYETKAIDRFVFAMEKIAHSLELIALKIGATEAKQKRH